MVCKARYSAPHGFLGLWWRTLLNQIRFARPADRVRVTILFLLGIVFVSADYLFFFRLWSAILVSPLPAIQSIQMILSTVLSLFLVFLFYSNLLSCLSTMYASQEISLLLSTPVRFRYLFATSFLQTVSRSSAMFVLFGLPALVALARAFHAPVVMWIVFFPLLSAFIVVPGAAGLSVCHILMRFLPRRRVHQALVVVGLTLGAALVAGLRMLRIEYLWGSGAEQLQVVTSLMSLSKESPHLAPAGWLVRSLLGALGGVEAEGAWAGCALGVLSLACLAGCYLLTRWLYLEAWSRSWSGSDAAVGGRPGRLPGVAAPVNALITKEFLSVRRRLYRWSQVLMMLPLMGLYILNLAYLPIEGEAWAGMVVWINLGVVGFLVAAVGARFLVPAISADSRAYWILRASPLWTRTIVLTKFTLYSLPVLLLAIGCCVCIQILIPSAPSQFLIGLFCTVILTGTLCALGIGVGAAFPKFDARNDLEISLGAGGLFYMLLALLFVGFSDWWLLLPFLKILPRIREWLPLETISLPWRVGVFVMISAICACGGLAVGIRRLARFER